MRPCAKSGLVVIFIPHRRPGFLHLTPHPLVTLFRIRVIFLITLLRRKITPLRTAATFSLVLSRLIHLLFSEAIYMLAKSKYSSLPSTALSLSSLSCFCRSFSLSSFSLSRLSHTRVSHSRVFSLSSFSLFFLSLSSFSLFFPATPKRCLRVCVHAFSVCTPARP